MTLSFINMPLLAYIHEISAPYFLFMVKMPIRVISKLTGDNKELMIIPGANHTDLYDRTIPF